MDSRIQVIGEAANGRDAIVKARELTPDVVILDVDMPDISGVEVAARLITLPHPPNILALSVHTKPPWPQRLLEAGALGYVAKERSEAEIVEAVHVVHQGIPFMSPTLVGCLLSGKNKAGFHDPFTSLSHRQLEIMTLLIKGKSPENIAELLHVSPKTIYTHRDRIREKLNVSNDIELMHLAIRYGIVKFS